MSGMGWNYLDPSDRADILRGIRDGRAYGGPYHVDVYPADRCNIECFFCSTAPLRDKDQISTTRLDELFCELKEAGTRSVGLAGGGEPLFHRGTKDYLRSLARLKLPVENVTTNGVLMDEEVSSLFVEGRAEEVTVSLNTGDRDTYATMMQTPARNFDRIVENMRRLQAIKKAHHTRSPILTVQFLVWKGNYRSIPAMYDLARDIGVESIIFNGISHLTAEQKMTPEETGEMLDLYEGVLRIDEYRTVKSLTCFEQDISAELSAISARLHEERQRGGMLGRIRRYLGNGDFTLAQRLRHTAEMRRVRRVSAASAEMPDSCIMGWHSMTIRATGTIAPCCVLQGKRLGNIYEQSVREIWFGEAYDRFRQELRDIMLQGPEWQYSTADHRTVVPQCATNGFGGCPVRSFYYQADIPFLREFDRTLSSASRP